jgi:serine/threonine protein kinase
MAFRVGSYNPLEPKKPHPMKASKGQVNVFKRIYQYFHAIEESNKQIEALIKNVSKSQVLDPKAQKALKTLLRSNVEKKSTGSKVDRANAVLKEFNIKATWISKPHQKKRILLTATGPNKTILGEGTYKRVSKAVEISGRINLLTKERLFKERVHYERANDNKPLFQEEVEMSKYWSDVLHANKIPGDSWKEDPSQLFLKYNEVVEGDEPTLTAKPLALVNEEMLSELSDGEKKLFITQLISANAFLKQKNLLHRDIKLDNLLLKTDKNGQKQLVIADFGLMENRRVSNKDGSFGGTPDYMPPKALNEGVGDYANRQDDFSFGIVLLQLAFNYDIEELFYSNQATLDANQVPYSPDRINQIVDLLKLMKNPLCDLIAGLLAQPPQERISMENAIALSDQIKDEHFHSFST